MPSVGRRDRFAGGFQSTRGHCVSASTANLARHNWMIRKWMMDGIDTAEELPSRPATSSELPIAAGVLQFPSVTRAVLPDGKCKRRRMACGFASRYEGVDHLELSNRWVDITELSR